MSKILIPSCKQGLHRGLPISVAVFALLFIAIGCKHEPDPWEGVWDRDELTPEEMMERMRLDKIIRKKAMVKLAEIWVTLNQSRVMEFNLHVDKLRGSSAMYGESAEVLKMAYAELSYHQDLGNSHETSPLPPPISTKAENWRERMLLQLQLHSKARREGMLDVGTMARILSSMEVDLERLHWARSLTPVEIQACLEGKGPEPPSRANEFAKEAARLIEKFESASPPRKPGE